MLRELEHIEGGAVPTAKSFDWNSLLLLPLPMGECELSSEKEEFKD